MSTESAQIAGILVGGLVGFIVGLVIVARTGAGAYRHVGGGWFEVIRPASHGFRGCLVEILLTALGAAVGYVVGGMLAG